MEQKMIEIIYRPEKGNDMPRILFGKYIYPGEKRMITERQAASMEKDHKDFYVVEPKQKKQTVQVVEEQLPLVDDIDSGSEVDDAGQTEGGQGVEVIGQADSNDANGQGLLSVIYDEQQANNTWWFNTLSDGSKIVVTRCTNGHVGALGTHEISADGIVSPSVVCQADGCDFHAFIKLEGYKAEADQSLG